MTATDGLSSSAWWETFNPPGSSLRTSQAQTASRITTLKSSRGYRAWATGLRKAYSRRLKSAPRTGENDSSSWPTPNVGTANSTRGQGQDPERRKAQGHQVMLQDVVRYWQTLSGSTEGANLKQDAEMWPTPRANDFQGDSPGATAIKGKLNHTAPRWATPSARDYREDGANDPAPEKAHLTTYKSRLGRQAPRILPPGPQSSESGPTSPRRCLTCHRRLRAGWIGSPAIPVSVCWKCGQVTRRWRRLFVRLNPAFVCWLMGWPEGWPDTAQISSGCSAMALSRYALVMRSLLCAGGS